MFEHAVMSPDGQFLFAQGGIEQLCCYLVRGDDLVLQAKSERIAQNGQCVVVSPDSKFVCLPSGGGNYTFGAGGGSPYSTFIYSVSDLKTPKLTIKSGAYPRALAFDPVGKWIYAQNHSKQLILFD